MRKSLILKYNDANKRVSRSARPDIRQWFNEIVVEAQKAADRNRTRELSFSWH